MSKKSVGADRLDAVFATMTAELSSLSPTDAPTRFAVDRLLARMKKRARITRRDLREETFASFIQTNSSLLGKSISLDPQLVRDARHFITVVLERFTTAVDPRNIQITLDHNILAGLWRFGPGSSNGVRGTHAVDKLRQDMSCTPLSEPWVLKLRAANVYMSKQDMEHGIGVTLVHGSRLSTVPKNEESERTIALEPSGNMCLQLAAGRYLEAALRFIGLDIRNQQTLNKLLAKLGSINGRTATIDLSKASDMILIELVRMLMPPSWFSYLMQIRSPTTTIKGQVHELNMISTMGNGFTFPLMTLLIVALIYGFRCQRGGPLLRVDWSETAVFGDDIIIPVDEYESFCEVLEQAGLVVNKDKSYSDGSFRESCGGDYYEGHDVTPFYIKTLSHDRGIYVALNQVFEWCARQGCLLPNTILHLRSLLRGKLHLVPEWHGPDEGFRTSRVPRRYTYLKTIIPQVRLDYEDSHPYKMMLACGGYVEGDGPDMLYSPRPYKTQARVWTSRLPRGYLDGRCPSRGERVSNYVEAYTFLLEA